MSEKASGNPGIRSVADPCGATRAFPPLSPLPAAVGLPAPAGRTPGVSRHAKAGFLFAALLAGLALALPAQAQRADSIVLVGNVTGTTNTSGPSVEDQFGDDDEIAQEFTTGPNAYGYLLHSVELFSSHTDEEYSASVCHLDEQGGTDRNSCIRLMPPANFAGAQAANAQSGTVFTVPTDRDDIANVYPDGWLLTANTTYGLFIKGNGPVDRRLHLIGDGGEDAGGQPGWSIADSYQIRELNVWVDPTTPLPLKVKFNGTVVDAAPAADNMPVIVGFPQVGNTLSVSTSAITDEDGLGSPTYAYEWTRVGVFERYDPDVVLSNTASTYTVVEEDRGHPIRVKVTFQDSGGNAEERTSANTGGVAVAELGCGNVGTRTAPISFGSRETAIWCATLTLGDSYTTRSKGYCDVAAGRDSLERGACKEDYGSLSDTDFVLDGTTYTIESLRIGGGGRSKNNNSIHLTLDQDLPGDEDSLLRLSLVVDSISDGRLNLNDASRRIPANEFVVDNNYRWPGGARRAPGSAGFRVTAYLIQGPPRAPVFGLIGNADQTADTTNPAAPGAGVSLSQEFTTGPHPDGYVLNSIEMFDNQEGDAAAYALSVCELDGSGDPDRNACTALAGPVSPSDRELSPSDPADRKGKAFAAPARTVLSADTTYSLVLVSSAADVMLDTVASGAEDNIHAPGWSLANSHQALSGSTWSNPSPPRPLKMRINGRVRDVVSTPATGDVTIDGAAQAGNTLVVSAANVKDDDGLGNSNFWYQWVQVDGAGDETVIEGATGNRYTATADDVGMRLRAKVMFRDGVGELETLSETTPVTVAAPYECGTNTGAHRSVWCATLTVGEPEPDETLSPSAAPHRGYCNSAARDAPCTGTFGSLSESHFVLDGESYTVESVRWDVDNRSFPANQILQNNVHLTLDRNFPIAGLGKLSLRVDNFTSNPNSLALDQVFALPEGRRPSDPEPDTNYLWQNLSRPFHGYPVGLRITVELLQDPPPVAAASTLVSNVRTTPSAAGPNSADGTVFQDFVTGRAPGGYTLDSVEIFHQDVAGIIVSSGVSLCSLDAVSGRPTSDCTALTAPQTFANNSLSETTNGNRFTAPANTMMSPGTTYSLRIIGTGVRLHTAGSGNEDSDGESGWRLANVHRVLPTSGPLADGTLPLKVRIHGIESAAAGLPEIRGVLQASHTLEAWTGDIRDSNGLRNVVYEYQWIRVDSDAEVDIPGANSSAYRLSSLDVGKNIRLRVNFRDDQGNREQRISMPTEGVVTEGPHACRPGNVWCATLTVGRRPNGESKGYCDPATDSATAPGIRCRKTYGSLSDTEFTLRGTDYTVESVRWGGNLIASSNNLHLTMDRDFEARIQSRLTLMVESHEFSLAGADRAIGTTTGRQPAENSYRWTGVAGEFASIPEGRNVTVQAVMAPNQPPAFDPVAQTRTIPENSGGGVSVGQAIPAATDDLDGNALTYTMVGRDAASFSFDAATLQISTATGVSYDYETRSSYTVTVQAADTEGGVGAVEVTINLTNIAELPDAPAAPVVASANSTDSLEVEWVAPVNAGPPITGYGVRYCPGAATDCAVDSAFTDHPTTGLGTSTTVRGLTSGTTYQVQVRAGNSDGEGPWSASGSGMTNSPGNNSPTFAETVVTRTVNEEVSAGTPVGVAIPEATDADTVTVVVTEGETVEEPMPLTYSMLGADADLFAFDAATRQISTAASVSYDFETRSSYTVTIRADDGVGGTGLLTVRILLNNVDEPSVMVVLTARQAQVSEDGSNPQPVVVAGVLDGLPETQDVTIDLSVVDGTARSPDDYTATGATLTITAGSTVGRATVMVTVVDDMIDEGDERASLTGTLTSSQVLAVATPEGLGFAILDDDTRGVRVTPTELQVSEDGGATYTVVLNTQPDGGPVMVRVRPETDNSDNSQRGVRVGPSPTLMFTETNWRMPQMVTVALHDPDENSAMDEDETVAHEVSGADYDGVTVATVTVLVKGFEVIVDEHGARTGVRVSVPRGGGMVEIPEPDGVDLPDLTVEFGPGASGGSLAVREVQINDGDGPQGFSTGDVAVDLTLESGGMAQATVCLPSTRPGARMYRSENGAAPWMLLPPPPGGSPDGMVCGVTENFSVFTLGTGPTDEAEDEAWLARFGRTAASQVVDAVGARLNQPQASQAQLNLGGATPQTALLSGALKMLSGEAAVDAKQALTNSSFVLPLAGNGKDMWTAWGRGAYTDFEGKENDVDLDGEVTTGTIGVDFARGDWLTGVALSHSEGDGDSRDMDDESGEMDISLTTVSPYARVDLGDGMGIWGVAGYGEGDLERDHDGEKREVDLDMQMAAAGIEGPVGSIETESGGFDLKLKADAMTVRMESDGEEDLPELEADAQRFRLLLSGAGNYPSESGGTAAPTLEAGVRWDEGDAETGLGIELGAGVRFADANGRFHTELKARGLVAHEESDYDEWGVSGALALAPERNGRGLTLKLESGYGATESGTQALWTRRDLAGLAPDESAILATRLGLELGYGLNGPAGRGTWMPYLSYQDGSTAELRLGTRLDFGEAMRLELVALRRDEEFGEMSISLQGRW